MADRSDVLYNIIMSFFGFDPAGPAAKNGQLDLNKFQDFGDELEDDDAFNDETFGNSAAAPGNDFDFGGRGKKETAGLRPAPIPQQTNLSYATAAQTSSQNDSALEPMQSLWGSNEPQQQPQAQPEQKVYSLEEVEARMRQQPVAPQHQIQVPQFPPGMNPFMLPPQAQQQLLASYVATGRYPDIPSAARAMAQASMSQMPQMPFMGYPPMMGMQGMPQMPQMQGMPGQLPMMPPQQQMPVPQVQQPQVQQVQQVQQPQIQQPQVQQPQVQQPQSQAQAPAPAPAAATQAQTPAAPQVSQAQQLRQTQSPEHSAASPVQKSSVAAVPRAPRNARPNRQLDLDSFPSIEDAANGRNTSTDYRQPSSRNFRHHLSPEDMSPEDRQKFLARQNKVGRITRASGFMNPRDKDFVTRFQLSQIVTDDPYNEDFYCQVYKVLNSNGGDNSTNSIARKYLEQSGHRLGGRGKRADVALQRMQQQVSKAVSVAKERGERKGTLSKEGALGAVSFGSGKRPRQQLVVESEESQDSMEDDDVPKEYKFSRSARSFQLSIIEKVYNEVLKLESSERENAVTDDAELWKALHVNDTIQTSNGEINAFVSLFAYDKFMKVFTRVFHLLSIEHKAELVEQFFKSFQKVDVVLRGSYRNYAEQKYELPKDVKSKIELFQITVLKALVLYLSESAFPIVLHFLQTALQNNNAFFLTTAQTSLSLITILITRLELIKQEYAQTLDPQELSQWDQSYDQLLFKPLEGRMAQVFPPYFSHDDARKVSNSLSDGDDSYIWQYLAALSLAGQLTHQRVIIDEVRGEIFGTMAEAKKLKSEGKEQDSEHQLSDLNLFLNVMGLKANENDITEASE